MNTASDVRQVPSEVCEDQQRLSAGAKAWLYLMLVAMLMIWSFNYIFAKVAIREFPILALSGIRIQAAALMLLAIFLVRRGRAGFALFPPHWKLFSVFGLFGVALNQGLFVVGLKYTSVAHTSLIVAAGPVFVLILARLLGLEELTWLKLTGLALSLAGLGILVSERHAGQQSGLLGDLLNTCGVLAFAYYVILGKQTALRFDSLSQNTFMFLTGGAMMLPLTASAFFTHGLAQVTWRGWLSMLYMAAFSSVAAYLIFYYALKHVSATRMSALSYLQPPCATFLSWMLLKEPVTAAVISGAIVIFVGVFMTEKG